MVPLELVDRVAPTAAGAGRASCTASSRGDVEALCALPFDINEIHRIATRDRERVRRLLAGAAHDCERGWPASSGEGVAAGELRAVDPRLTALTIMANDEGVQNWYRLGARAVGDPARSARRWPTWRSAACCADRPLDAGRRVGARSTP